MARWARRIRPTKNGAHRNFDTGLDGRYGDQALTGTGADAFGPEFCGGLTAARTPDVGCKDDKGGAEYGARVGYDWQAGRLVYGAVLEQLKNNVRHSATGFSTTPAYTCTRALDETRARRGRFGYAFGERQDIPGDVTPGVVRAGINRGFTTTNGANSFTGRGNDNAHGDQVVLGVEHKVGDHFSLGLEDLFTRLDDDHYRVRVGPGTAPPSNLFLLDNAAGTDMRCSDDRLSTNAIRVTASYRF